MDGYKKVVDEAQVRFTRHVKTLVPSGYERPRPVTELAALLPIISAISR